MEKKPKIYMVVGCPGAGKSWVCEQLTDKFKYVHHDGFIYLKTGPKAYVDAILEAAEDEKNKKPILIEAPFSISQTKDPLEAKGYPVECVYIIEDHRVIADRYKKRDSKEIPRGHLTRQNTYLQRAKNSKAFTGTSDEVLEHLKKV